MATHETESVDDMLAVFHQKFIARLVEVLATARADLAAFALLVATGAQVTEVAALRWEDIDLDGARVTFGGSVDLSTRSPRYQPADHARTVVIGDTTVGFLRQLDRSASWPSSGTAPPTSPRNWTSRWGKHAREHHALVTFSALREFGRGT